MQEISFICWKILKWTIWNNNFWSVTKIKTNFRVYRKTVFRKTCSKILLKNLGKYV